MLAEKNGSDRFIAGLLKLYVSSYPKAKNGGMQDALSTLRQMLGEEPSDEDVADYMGLSVDAYHELLRDAQRRFSLSLSRPIDDDEQTMLDVLPNEDAEASVNRPSSDCTTPWTSRSVRLERSST